MSNCIDIDNRLLIFPPQKIALGPILRKVAGLRNAPNDNDGSIAWWFLEANTQIDVEGRTTIHLGRGRSPHTFRDFQATMLLLCRCMRPRQSFTWITRIRDAENVPSDWYKLRIKFCNETKALW